MNEEVIWSMYNRGLSVDFIVDQMYRKKKNEAPRVIKVGDTVIIRGRRVKKSDARKEVEQIILAKKTT